MINDDKLEIIAEKILVLGHCGHIRLHSVSLLVQKVSPVCCALFVS